MTFFVTHSFADLSSVPLASEAADKNRPNTVFNYLTHYFGDKLSRETSCSALKSGASALKYLMSREISGLEMCPAKLSRETQDLGNFGGQSERIRTALNPFKYALYSAFKQLQNGFKICQTVL